MCVIPSLHTQFEHKRLIFIMQDRPLIPVSLCVRVYIEVRVGAVWVPWCKSWIRTTQNKNTQPCSSGVFQRDYENAQACIKMHGTARVVQYITMGEWSVRTTVLARPRLSIRILLFATDGRTVGANLVHHWRFRSDSQYVCWIYSTHVHCKQHYS